MGKFTQKSEKALETACISENQTRALCGACRKEAGRQNNSQLEGGEKERQVKPRGIHEDQLSQTSMIIFVNDY
jgi:hypothetical protein